MSSEQINTSHPVGRVSDSVTRQLAEGNAQCDAIQSLGPQLVGLANQATQAVDMEINEIIQSGNSDEARIEHLLDHMLGFCYAPEMLQAFKRLCRYYYTLNPSATVDYVHAYRDMWDTAEEPEQESGV